MVIQTIADVAAAFLGLWILLYLLQANHANVFVGFVADVADALAWWSQDIFTTHTENLRVLLDYGLPAVIYLAVGHGVAIRLRRF
ncbi:membrane protein [Streptomyces incarnatus]|uniref:Membrane protein n=1 Tax=Streptomyces incarnatus TaxID=665007 RepID=A0ABM5TGF8_9ACTN|nr:membrane protein [Streptomyces incarnatus]